MTSDGSYYYVKNLEYRPQVEFADLHPPHADSAQESKEPLFGGSPKWAPDGHAIAVMRQRPDRRPDLVVRSFQTGQEMKFSLGDNDRMESAVWFNDNRALLVVAYHPAESEGQRRSLYRADLRTGELKELSNIGRFYAVGAFQAVISPDDSILYVRGELSEQKPAQGGFRTFTAVDLATGVRRKVVDAPAGQVIGAGPALSGDGRVLAFVTGNDASGFLGEGKLARVNVDGSDYRELAVVRPSVGSLAWTADGLSILFAERDASMMGRLMRVPSAGGTAEFTGLQIDGLSALDVAATSDRVAYNRVTAWYELRALDNVRAVLKAHR
jgi:Tol biopolymer transport system component